MVAVLVFGTGCLKVNPAYDEPTSTSTTGSTGGWTTGGTTQAGGETTAGGSGSAGETTSGATLGETTGPVGGSTGDASSGGSTGGEAFCMPATQEAEQCAPLGTTGLLFCETVRTWGDAKAACAAMCGRLAIVLEGERPAVHAELAALMTEQDKIDEQNIEAGVDSVTANRRSSVWIGARTEAKDGPYAWVDGSPMPAAWDMFGWGPTDPDYSGLCVVLGLFGKGDHDGDYFDRQCVEEPYRYLCEPE